MSDYQELQDFIDEYKIKFTAQKLRRDKGGRSTYKIIFTKPNTKNFACIKNYTCSMFSNPTIIDVLSCIRIDMDTFLEACEASNFVDHFGSSVKEALSIFNGCRDKYVEFKEFFSDVEMKKFLLLNRDNW